MKCHYCHSPLSFYLKMYCEEGATWLRCPFIFHSCQNKKCPYHRELVDGEITTLPREKIYFKKVDMFYSDYPDDENEIDLDKRRAFVS